MYEPSESTAGSETYSEISFACSSTLLKDESDTRSETSSIPSSHSSEGDYTTSEYSLSYSDYGYDYDTGYDLWLDCSLCNGRDREDSIALSNEERDRMFEPYRDFRSVGRAKQRERRSREDKSSRCNSYKGRKREQAWRRMINKRAKREKVRFAILESQKEVVCFTRNFQPTKHKVLAWDIKLPEELDEWVMNMNDDLVRYIVLHQDADTFESPKSYLQVGEDFATWCQRRIAEMRNVKESRIRRNAPTSFRPTVWESKMEHRHGKRYNVYTGEVNITTLPTNSYDALGHELLRSALTPGRWWLKDRQRNGESPFRTIEGYKWFGEYEWSWHRNMSGCWEIGYGGQCAVSEDDWENAAIPCPHCCAESWGMFYGCYCREGKVGCAPEEMQRCSLIEWVGQEGRTIMMQEEAQKDVEMHASPDLESYESENGDGWDMVSIASSGSWNVINAES